MRTPLLLFVLLLTMAFAPPVWAGDTPPYEGYEQDRALLRDHEHITNPPLNASSGKAGAAAQRLFSKVTFVGMTRARVLAILGDPKTISDYGIAAPETPDSPLHYRLDTGYGGWEYVLKFQDGTVTALSKTSLD